MIKQLRTGALAALFVAAAASMSACSDRSADAAAVPADLQHDLDAATSSAVQLAPQSSNRTQVVSASELGSEPAAMPTRTPQRGTSVRRQSAKAPAVAPTPEPETPRAVVATEPSPEPEQPAPAAAAPLPP